MTGRMEAARPTLTREKSKAEKVGLLDSDAVDVVLCGVFLLTCFLDTFSKVKLGSISLNGVLTVLYTAIVGLLLLVRGGIPTIAFKALRWSILLALWGVASVLWNRHPSKETVQNLSVLFTFVATCVLVVSARVRQGRSALRLIRLLPFAIFLASFLFLGAMVVAKLNHQSGLAPRAFALYVAVASMWFAAGWRYRRKGARIATILIVALIALSLSRTALAVTVLMLPWVVWFHAKRAAGWARPIAMTGLLGVISVVVIVTVPALHKRFLSAGDRAVSVNGTSISTEGRAQIWVAVFNDSAGFRIIGRGAGSASDLVTEQFGSRIAQPHNDYLRIFHDYGIVGLWFWLAFVFSMASTLRTNYLSARDRNDYSQQRAAVAAAAGLLVVSLSMATDNVFVYLGPMFIEAILIGNAVGENSARRAFAWQ